MTSDVIVQGLKDCGSTLRSPVASHSDETPAGRLWLIILISFNSVLDCSVVEEGRWDAGRVRTEALAEVEQQEVCWPSRVFVFQEHAVGDVS